MDHFDQALNFIQAGRLDEARIYLEELLKQDPENVDLLYNLGMLYTDLGKPDMSIALLKQCIKLSPRHANAHVALGFSYMNSGDLKSAKEYTLQALKIVPNDPIALRNLGGILGKEKDFLNAFYQLQKSYDINPHDPQTVYGLAFAYKSLNDFENAEKYFKALLDMRAPDTLKELAREGLGEIAFKTLKSQGPRMDVVLYILSALETFKGKSTQKVKDISFEIGMLGRQGFEINDPTKKFTLRTLPGEFTALQLVSMMYTGFKQFDPSLDIGMDFSEEYGLALKLAQSEDLR
ncbi:MAG: tetratricopeptide repeat protein [Methanothrix sp.]